jgi:competence protein ComEC
MQALQLLGRGAWARGTLRNPGLNPARAVIARILTDWAAAEQGRFALWLPLWMVAGAGTYLLLTAEPPAWLGAAAAGLAAAALLLLRRRLFARAVCAVALAGSLGFAAGQVATWRAPKLLNVPTHAVIVSGTVRAVEILPQGRRVTLEAPVLTTRDGTAPPAARLVRIRLRKDDALLPATGDVLHLRALLSRPSPPSYPGAWDLQRDAFFSGMGAYGFALGPAVQDATARPDGTARWLQRVRESITANIATVLSGPEAAIATTLLTGNPSAVPPDDKAAFRDSGLAHLLAIAGLHIGIVMGLVFGSRRGSMRRCAGPARPSPR